jgi:hypothetical protein
MKETIINRDAADILPEDNSSPDSGRVKPLNIMKIPKTIKA